MKPKAIQTYYNGYHFRSRLEARWAVFFDALGVKYEYEPEGFETDDGTKYLPDFRVKCYGYRGETNGEPHDLYIEVKGELSDEDVHKIVKFANYHIIDEWSPVIDNPILVVGCIPEHNDVYNLNDGIFFDYGLIDGDEGFGAYPAATEDGKFYLWGADSNYINRKDIPRVCKAYDIARQARFEYGETPIL